MKKDSRNFRIGAVDVFFHSPKDPARSSSNKSRMPKILRKTIYLPNDKDIKVIQFPNTTECLIIGGCGVFGDSRLQVLWCGDRIGSPFIFGFTGRVAKIGRKGNMEEFLEFIKPKRTTGLNVYDEFGKPVIYDTVWLTKMPGGYYHNMGIAYFEQMIFGKMKVTQGLNQLGYETFLNHTKIYAEYGIKEFKIGATWCAVANRPTVRCYSTYDAKLLDGHYFIEPSRFQVYLPKKLNGR